jgi:hypothetical protein
VIAVFGIIFKMACTKTADILFCENVPSFVGEDVRTLWVNEHIDPIGLCSLAVDVRKIVTLDGTADCSTATSYVSSLWWLLGIGVLLLAVFFVIAFCCYKKRGWRRAPIPERVAIELEPLEDATRLEPDVPTPDPEVPDIPVPPLVLPRRSARCLEKRLHRY